MKKITEPFILHIGMPKCGSTALQHFLSVNDELLHSNGFCYPAPIDGGKNHRAIAMWLLDQCRPSKAGPRSEIFPQMRSSDAEYISLAMDQLRSNLGDKINILSSEGFSGISPSFLVQYFSEQNTKIVIYVREQLDYLLSSYAQIIHARKVGQSFAAFTNRYWMIDYAAFVDCWVNVFGRHNVLPRIYDRSRLKGGDVCEDFMELLGVSDTGTFSFPPMTKSNPSIGGPLLKFKLLLNTVSDWDEKRLLQGTYRSFGALASLEGRFRSRMSILPELAREIRSRYEASNELLFKEYFPEFDGFTIKDVGDECDDRLLLEDFEYICSFLKEYPSKDPKFHSDNVVDAHYMKMKNRLLQSTA